MAVAVTKVFGRRGPEIKAQRGDYKQSQIANDGTIGIGLSGPELLVDFTARPEQFISINLDHSAPVIKFKFRPGSGQYWIQFVQAIGGSVPKLVNVDGGLIFFTRGMPFSSAKDSVDLVTIIGSNGLAPSIATVNGEVVRQPGD